MALEIEIKFTNADLKALRDKLLEAGASRLGGHFESNRVFDTPDRSLFAKNILLRLRQMASKPGDKSADGLMTLKRPPAAADEKERYKVWQETETRVTDAAALAEAFHALGCGVTLVYEKLREEWRLEACTVCLDRLPFGDVVELEGSPAAIEACAGRLGLDMAQGTDKTYHALNKEYRRANNLPDDDSFAFAPDTVPTPWWAEEK